MKRLTSKDASFTGAVAS